MGADERPQREGVFIAATVAEAEEVEELLEREGIEFELTPEAFLRGVLTGACLQGLLFEVLAGQAPYCRRLLIDAGLARGVVDPHDSAS
jgi:hypothetical protein